MNEQLEKLAAQANDQTGNQLNSNFRPVNAYAPMDEFLRKFAELIMEDMHRKVIASILITDVVGTATGREITSEDYIRAINHDFGIEE
jgi:hypothetical protein